MKSAKTAKAMKALASNLGRPPRTDEIIGNLEGPGAPKPQASEGVSVQLNLRVPAAVKRRVRLLAARDAITHSELVTRAIDLYDKQLGNARASDDPQAPDSK